MLGIILGEHWLKALDLSAADNPNKASFRRRLSTIHLQYHQNRQWHRFIVVSRIRMIHVRVFEETRNIWRDAISFVRSGNFVSQILTEWDATRILSRQIGIYINTLTTRSSVHLLPRTSISPPWPERDFSVTLIKLWRRLIKGNAQRKSIVNMENTVESYKFIMR